MHHVGKAIVLFSISPWGMVMSTAPKLFMNRFSVAKRFANCYKILFLWTGIFIGSTPCLKVKVTYSLCSSSICLQEWNFKALQRTLNEIESSALLIEGKTVGIIVADSVKAACIKQCSLALLLTLMPLTGVDRTWIAQKREPPVWWSRIAGWIPRKVSA